MCRAFEICKFIFCQLKNKVCSQTLIIFACTFHTEVERIHFSNQNVSAYKLTAAISVQGNPPIFFSYIEFHIFNNTQNMLKQKFIVHSQLYTQDIYSH